MMAKPYGGSTVAADLGLGSLLKDQVADETEEQKRKRRLGLSPMAKDSAAVGSIFDFGNTGVG